GQPAGSAQAAGPLTHCHRMNTRTFALLLLSVLGLTGCAGYRLGGQKPAHLVRISKLAVPTFENLSLEPRLGPLPTNAVIKQLQLGGAYLIEAEGDAEAVLAGKITRVRRQPFRSDSDNGLRTSQLLLTRRTEYTD